MGVEIVRRLLILEVILKCYATFAFVPSIRVSFRAHRGLASNEENSFEMPTADKLISDIPEDQRGIGVGIDLGTTNSAVSILTKEGLPKIIQLKGKSTIPSIVSIQEDDESEYHVGDDKLSSSDESIFTYRNVKRVIGMGTIAAACSAEVVPHLDIQTAAQRRKGRSMNKKNKKEGLAGIGLEDMIKEAQENPIRLHLPRRKDSLENENNVTSTTSPEFISSRILKTLFDAVEKETGERVTRAVIGVPAYFDDMQREATIEVSLFISVFVPFIFACTPVLLPRILFRLQHWPLKFPEKEYDYCVSQRPQLLPMESENDN